MGEFGRLAEGWIRGEKQGGLVVVSDSYEADGAWALAELVAAQLRVLPSMRAALVLLSSADEAAWRRALRRCGMADDSRALFESCEGADMMGAVQRLLRRCEAESPVLLVIADGHALIDAARDEDEAVEDMLALRRMSGGAGDSDSDSRAAVWSVAVRVGKEPSVEEDEGTGCACSGRAGLLVRGGAEAVVRACASLLVECRPLASGHARGIHGRLHVQQRSAGRVTLELEQPYAVSEAGARVGADALRVLERGH